MLIVKKGTKEYHEVVVTSEKFRLYKTACGEIFGFDLVEEVSVDQVNSDDYSYCKKCGEIEVNR